MTMTNPEGHEEAPTLETLQELTRSIRELRDLQRERMEEMDRRMDLRFQEAERRSQEAERRSREADRRIQETDRQMQETDRRLKKAENLFTTQWGRLMESLVEGDLVRLLLERNVEVERTVLPRTNRRRNGESYQVDIVAVNGREVVVVEVKTTLRPEHVGRFATKLERFKDWWPEYRDRRVFGALAYLESWEDVTTHAERQGFFVIRATGESASIVNSEDFEPRVFA
ncbi:MAG: hypothetical protein OXH70_09790 [Acidobacteria bacterium]|nr:hypothetical protein [Acidobacteriota bacterium]